MRQSRVEIDLAAIAHNIGLFTERVAPANVMAVVKANAYGHGDVPVSTTALAAGASSLAVAIIEEGVRLREAGVDAPILLLSEPSIDEVEELWAWNLTPSVYRPEFVDALARRAPHEIGVQLVVDTGMHRVGVEPGSAVEMAEKIVSASNLQLTGVWSHFAVAEEDAAFSLQQMEQFNTVVVGIRSHGIDPGVIHLPNTAGALYLETRSSLARIGLGMYGIHPDPLRPVLALHPAMRVVSTVSFVQRVPAGGRPSYGRRRELTADSTIATVPIGYADGVPRVLSSRGGEVLIGGRRRPFAGTVTMDQVMIDCGDDPVAVGAEVVLIGRQGDESVTVDEWAELTGTVSWEILTGFSDRLPRRHLG